MYAYQTGFYTKNRVLYTKGNTSIIKYTKSTQSLIVGKSVCPALGLFGSRRSGKAVQVILQHVGLDGALVAPLAWRSYAPRPCCVACTASRRPHSQHFSCHVYINKTQGQLTAYSSYSFRALGKALEIDPQPLRLHKHRLGQRGDEPLRHLRPRRLCALLANRAYCDVQRRL